MILLRLLCKKNFLIELTHCNHHIMKLRGTYITVSAS